MGPPNAKEVLLDAYALGADLGVHVNDRAVRGSDTFATAGILAAAVKIRMWTLSSAASRPLTVIPLRSDRRWLILGLPHVAYVKKIREVTESEVVCERD